MPSPAAKRRRRMRCVFWGGRRVGGEFSDFPDMALFRGEVVHVRRRPVLYRHRQKLLLFFGHADKMEAWRRWLQPLAALGVVDWRRGDYLSPPTLSLGEAVRAEVRRLTGIEAAGPVFVLAQPRQFGCAYNPAAFYFVEDGEAGRAAYLLVEVHNTPWGERFAYAAAYGGGEEGRASLAKKWRVSPFNSLDMTYRWRFGQPRARFVMRMQCVGADGGVDMEAVLVARRVPLTRGALAAALCARPASAAAAKVAIYRRALGIWRRGVAVRREQFGEEGAGGDGMHGGG